MELHQGEPTTRHLAYFRNMIYLLREHQIKPILIFDGAKLIAKAETNDNRGKTNNILPF